MLSNLEMDILSQQHTQLLAFAARYPIHDANAHVERLLRRVHDVNAAEWAQTLACRPGEDTVYVGQVHSPLDALGASGVGMQFRLVCEFATHFPLNVARHAQQFLRDVHGLSVADWEQVEAFLNVQEASWLEERGDEKR